MSRGQGRYWAETPQGGAETLTVAGLLLRGLQGSGGREGSLLGTTPFLFPGPPPHPVCLEITATGSENQLSRASAQRARSDSQHEQQQRGWAQGQGWVGVKGSQGECGPVVSPTDLPKGTCHSCTPWGPVEETKERLRVSSPSPKNTQPALARVSVEDTSGPRQGLGEVRHSPRTSPPAAATGSPPPSASAACRAAAASSTFRLPTTAGPLPGCSVG